MHLLSGEPMHDLSGVDTRECLIGESAVAESAIQDVGVTGNSDLIGDLDGNAPESLSDVAFNA